VRDLRPAIPARESSPLENEDNETSRFAIGRVAGCIITGCENGEDGKADTEDRGGDYLLCESCTYVVEIIWSGRMNLQSIFFAPSFSINQIPDILEIAAHTQRQVLTTSKVHISSIPARTRIRVKKYLDC
jgi:hypothetical protein